MLGMHSSSEEMGPTEGAVLALLDFLVDPLLPARTTSRETITLSQEVLVAKQVHAVVVLYNYHHRIQHPDLKFLDFQSFCKLAVVLKPSLQLYFKLMQRTDAELEHIDEHLSLTEKAIMNACDISKSLDASSNYPIIEGWPVAKVAVFLIDYRKENCYLFHGSITQGVWSTIEKEVNGPSQGSEAVNKKKRVIKKASKENQTADVIGLQQLAYLAVKETCGINQCDLKILETHLVYSTSKPKTAVRLFIMQCTQTNQHANLVPINDVMDSLQGPLVRKDSISWIFTPVVEYFHLLPFADKVSDCLTSRVMSQNSSEHVEVAKDDGTCNISPEQLSNPSRMPQNSSQHVEAAKDDGNCKSFHMRPEQPSNASHTPQKSSPHVEAAKDDGSCKSLHSRPEQLSNPSRIPQNSSRHVEVPKDDINCKSVHIRPEQLSNLSNHIAANEIENRSGSPSMLETLLSNSAKNGTILQVNKEPFLITSEQNCTILQEKPLLSIPELQEVRNGNSNHLEEGTVPNVDNCHTEEPRHPEVAEVVKNNSSRRKWVPAEPVVYRKRNKSQKNNNSDKISGSKIIDASTDFPRLAQEQSAATPISHKKDILAQETDQTALAAGAIVVADFPVTSSHECDVEKDLSDNRVADTVMSDPDEKDDHALVPLDTDFKHLRKLQLTIASKEKLLSHTALNVLLRKREQLSLQIRNNEDEMALCERSIQAILNGSEDDLAVKLDSILEGCNEICMKSSGAAGDKKALHLEDQDLPPVARRKRLSEADVFALNPSQELDRICNTNYWMLPTYSLSGSEGGFLSTVTVKGVDFECSSEGTMHTNPHEARNSAASNILAKLRSMVAES
ncbi:uncharacterized protein LOC110689261 isoform X2 [Chenopodium quinoa]|uniref:uncharacterized protein LOC110689261 isoform X2 n=1 Tax=Chenopodium quinoa TaxID=63459 RepID=UPI000B79AF3E|nr:uncharacterized protein LOC110689261 isoform X2 [Chenopodium quinoa]